MERQAFPTSIGQLEIVPNGHRHIYVTGQMTVRGKTQTASAHFHLWADGRWHLGLETQPAYEQARNLFVNHPGGTEAFKAKVIETLTEAVNTYALRNPAILAQAEAEEVERCIADRNEKILNCQRAIGELKDELARITKGEILPQYSKVKAYD